MEQIQQLKEMRDLARKRIEQKRQIIEAQLRALTVCPDAQLVKSLSPLIIELESSINAAQAQVKQPTLDEITQDALEDAMNEPLSEETQTKNDLENIASQLRNSIEQSEKSAV